LKGGFEYSDRAKVRLKVVISVTLLIIFLLLYLNFSRIAETLNRSSLKTSAAAESQTRRV
jgi:Cu/Ag efflux pump CusA